VATDSSDIVSASLLGVNCLITNVITDGSISQKRPQLGNSYITLTIIVTQTCYLKCGQAARLARCIF